MEVIAKINVDTAKGRKIVRELEKHKRTVKLEHPIPESWVLHSVEEYADAFAKKLGEKYGVDDIRNL